MIVVAGGTGTLGTRLVPRLAGQGRAVRVLTRDPARAQHLAGPGVEVVRGDVRDPGSVAGALAGADTVISAVHGFAGPGGISPASVDRAGNTHMIDAAARTGAAFILVSVVGASPGHPIGLFRAKHAAEETLRASGIPWTIVRATAFMETWGTIIAGRCRHPGRSWYSAEETTRSTSYQPPTWPPSSARPRPAPPCAAKSWNSAAPTT